MDVTTHSMREEAMETSLQKRLRIRMDILGMNAYETANKAGLGPSFVRDILRGKSRNPTIEKLEKLAAALNTTVDWFLADATPQHSNGVEEIKIEGLLVRCDIQAGTWLDMSIIDDDPEHREIIPVARDPRFPRAKQYGLRVKGDSMDLEYPDGSYVSVVDFADSGLSVRAGLTVHVERRSGHLVEATLKVIELTSEGEMILSPRSSNPKHQPLRLEGDDSTEIVVCGVVTGSYRRTAL
ncbi:LexA family transcriptional regulator [Agrobacterium sp. FDAARGOS_525]|uniref:LexA family protein n=1 Tax=Agrobacterium sp. FDAARGOS_525 TaxID=2420311 RepID=UPI000F65A2B3|nr:LexA family transcriptional regulator [Agrobacterium sp. FDAARGOS_525]RSC37328.1 LexA family transcriptional regulator [Agrobacterium sp. FDAARGOS_525]